MSRGRCASAIKETSAGHVLILPNYGERFDSM
jgi:hypothetical protein